MKKYKVLVLTDHTRHSKENSLYAILQEMILAEECDYVDVGSRGLNVNDDFFVHEKFSAIYVSRVTDQFRYDESGQSYQQEITKVNPEDYDMIILRLPRPVTDGFLVNLKSQLSNAIFINDPIGIVKCSTKAYLMNFAECCPPMKMCNSIEDVIDFSATYDLVLKPLREYGGKGLLKIVDGIANDGVTDYDKMEYLLSIEDQIKSDGYLAMQYQRNVINGDKRLLVVDGEILGASLRLPPPDSWLCNVALGGTSIGSLPTDREREIVNIVYPKLKANGILICGFDTLENDEGVRVLSEINALSIGGFPQAQRQMKKPIIKQTIDKIFNYAAR